MTSGSALLHRIIELPPLVIMKRSISFFFVCLLLSNAILIADDWLRFRGPGGGGVASQSETLPSAWSPTNNLAWKTPLPGPGASSPIIVGEKVLVTCYSGYGLNQKEPGEIENLVRHLVCFDLTSGERLWQKDIKASLPEDLYDKSGVSSHGYASHTPVSDGQNVYCFFGKSGVYAFDLNGKALWNADAGQGSDPPVWGSACSPIIYESTLIVTASAESQSIIGFDIASGRRLWQHESKGLDGMWGTPILVQVDHQRTDLVMLVAGELWGLDPQSGDVRWQTKATNSQQAYASIIADANRVFAFSGQGGGGIAMDITGKGPEIIWNTSVFATYASPVRYQDRIYIVSRGMLTIVDTKSGKRLKKVRLKNSRRVGNARFGSLDYASPVVVGNRLFWLNAAGQVYVFRLDQDFEQLGINEVTNEAEIFWGSPAVSNGRMVLRSSTSIYCVSDQSSASGK